MLQCDFPRRGPGHARLVCNDEYKVTSIIGYLYRFACAIYPPQLANFEKVTPVLVQHTVSVEENCWPIHFNALKPRSAIMQRISGLQF